MDYNRLSCFSLVELLTMSPLALTLGSSYSLTSSPQFSSPLSPPLEDDTSKTNEIDLSLDYVYKEETKTIDQREEISLLQRNDDFKCFSDPVTPIYDNLFQLASDPGSTPCVSTDVTSFIEMLPTYKKVVIRGKENFQCRFIDCHFISSELRHLMEHQRTDHGVYECEQCTTLYFSQTERDNCVSIHESEKIAQTDILVNEFNTSIANGPTKEARVEKRHSNSTRRISISIARAQAQLVARRHLSIIASRRDSDILITSKRFQDCPVCGKTFRTLTSAKAHFRYAHSVIR